MQPDGQKASVIDLRVNDLATSAAKKTGARLISSVLEYLDKQPEHHRTRTFQEEYRELLRKHGVDFDERYVWD